MYGGEGFNGGQQDQRGDDEGRHVRALGRGGTLDEAQRQAKAGAEKTFATSHPAGVGFVIVAAR